MSLVPTGAGESRQLTHDAVSYSKVRFFPDGKRLLASGIEAGHGGRDYLIDLGSGDSKPITPDGVSGVEVSPDGRSTVVSGPDGKVGIWSLESGDFHPIPGLDSNYLVIGWTEDSESVYAVSRQRVKTAQIYRVNLQTGKMEPWKTLGEEAGTGVVAIGNPQLSSDGTAYAYVYSRILSEAYLVTGLK